MARCVVLWVGLLWVGCYDLNNTWDPYSPTYIRPARLEFDVRGALDFGHVNQTSTLTHTVNLRNAGGRAVSVTRLDVTGLGFGVVSAPTLPLTLLGNQSIPVVVEMNSPATAGYISGNLSAESPVGNPVLELRAKVASSAVTPVIGVVQGKNGRPVVYQSGDTFDFGGDRSPEVNAWQVPFYVVNTGTGSAANVTVQLTGSDFVLYGSLVNVVVVNGGQSSEFRIRFPTGALTGVKTGTVSVTWAGGGPFTLNLSGEVNPADPKLILVDRGDSQTFVRLSSVNRPAPLPHTSRDYRFINAGGGSLNLTGVSVDPAAITVGFTTATLASGQERIFQVNQAGTATPEPVLTVHTTLGNFNFLFRTN